MPGTLYVVSLPIGNADDITLRALHILRKVTVIAAESPERAQELLATYQITTTLTSYHRKVQEEKTAVLIEWLRQGKHVALVSDEGTPAICDPGTYLISQVRNRGIPIVPIPGPSALLAAFSISGFQGKAFTFAGTLPVRRLTRLPFLRSFRLQPNPIIFFVPASIMTAALQEIERVFGNRVILVARDMTKSGECFFHGRVRHALRAWQSDGVTGDLTLVIDGNSGKARRQLSDKMRRLKSPISSGSSRGSRVRRTPG